MLIVSFSSMWTLERFHLLADSGSENGILRKQALPPPHLPRNKEPKPTASQQEQLFWPSTLQQSPMGPLPPLLSGLIKSRHLQQGLWGTTQRAAGEPWGSPRICRKVKSHLL